MTLSTMKQAERVRREWPLFKILRRTRSSVLWEGPLRPLCQTYMIQVLVQREKNHHTSALLQGPQVTVIHPLLHQRSARPADPIPHHYPNSRHPERPFLCLYDPATREWHPGLAVARTIIPWTIEWLACYEGWLATGEWTGGGRHG